MKSLNKILVDLDSNSFFSQNLFRKRKSQQPGKKEEDFRFCLFNRTKSRNNNSVAPVPSWVYFLSLVLISTLPGQTDFFFSVLNVNNAAVKKKVRLGSLSIYGFLSFLSRHRLLMVPHMKKLMNIDTKSVWTEVQISGVSWPNIQSIEYKIIWTLDSRACFKFGLV